MHYVLAVKVGDTREHFLHDCGSFNVCELFSLLDLIVKFSTFAKPKLMIRFLSKYSNTI